MLECAGMYEANSRPRKGERTYRGLASKRVQPLGCGHLASVELPNEHVCFGFGQVLFTIVPQRQEGDVHAKLASAPCDSCSLAKGHGLCVCSQGVKVQAQTLEGLTISGGPFVGGVASPVRHCDGSGSENVSACACTGGGVGRGIGRETGLSRVETIRLHR